MIDAIVWGGRRGSSAPYSRCLCSRGSRCGIPRCKTHVLHDRSTIFHRAHSTYSSVHVNVAAVHRSLPTICLQNGSRALNTDAKMLPLATFATNGCGVAHKPSELWHCSEERFWSSCFIGRRAARLRLTYFLTRERETELLRNWYKSACYKRAIRRGREYR